MISLTWKKIVEFELGGDSVQAPWIAVLDTIVDATYLQIKAEGSWVAAPGLLAPCGPDGLAGIQMADRLITADCPIGALIGKVGGSTSSIVGSPAADSREGKPFAVGSQTVINIPNTAVGPLFVGFNILIRPVLVSRLKVTVSGATPTA